MTAPDVSIVIPCYNAERFVAQAIQSALDQGPNVEVIVVDDGSTDGSLDVIKSFGDRIHWRTGPNRGACSARNDGLALAHGEFVFFLDADDWLAGGAIQNALTERHRAEVDLRIGFIDFLDARTPKSWGELPYHSLMDILDGWISGRLRLGTGAFIWRRGFLLGIGGWNKYLLQKQDLELFAWAMQSIKSFEMIDTALIYHRRGHSPNQITARKDQACMRSHIDAVTMRMKHARATSENVGLGKFAYFAARDAFRHGFEEEGGQALALARCLGFAGHSGSAAHTIAATLLGLRRKERIAVKLRPPKNARRRAAV